MTQILSSNHINGFHSNSEDVDSKKFKILKSTDQIKELQTIIRDKETSRSDFKFVADRLIRMVIEEGLNQLPYQVIASLLKKRMGAAKAFTDNLVDAPTMITSHPLHCSS